MSAILESPVFASSRVSAVDVSDRVATAPHLEWTQIDSVTNTVWLGRVRGAFVGMVEQRGNEYAVTTRLGRSLGLFATLDDAQSAFIKR